MHVGIFFKRFFLFGFLLKNKYPYALTAFQNELIHLQRHMRAVTRCNHQGDVGQSAAKWQRSDAV